MITGLEPWLVHHLWLLVVGLGASAVVTIAIITMPIVVDWFRERSKLKAKDADVVAFTLKQSLAAGTYSTQTGVFDNNTLVQGFYDQREDKIVDARIIKAEKMSPEIAGVHTTPVVIWQ